LALSIYSLGIFKQRRMKTVKISVKIADDPPKIQSEQLPSTNQYVNLVRAF
jgi:hypothetical protein